LLLDVFDPPYMQRAALASLLLAVPFGLLGVWVVLRGLAFFAHAVGVATFPGVVVGLGVPAIGPFAGALAAGLAFAAGVTALERDDRVRGGAVTGLMLAAALALGTVLLTSAFDVAAPVESLLFGSLLAISTADLVRCAVVGVLAVAALVLALPRLAAGTFDRGWAQAAGARPGRVDALLLGLVAATVIVALPAAGNLLVSGLMVLPAAAARLLTDRLGPLLALSVALCTAESLGGLVLARELDAPPGAAIAVLGGLAFAAAALVRR
jgi:ABC-type Mn2+/Zn2+ transport system permease subunit